MIYLSEITFGQVPKRPVTDVLILWGNAISGEG